MIFANRLQKSIETSGSVLLAGCDPVIDKLPAFLQKDAASSTLSDGDYIQFVLDSFTEIFLAAIRGRVAAVKPNIAFYEQFGVAGLHSFSRFCVRAKDLGIIIIVDAKRGDIGNTSAAYSAAFLGRVKVRETKFSAFECDAVTVNPFLGFDTLEPYLVDCVEYQKGIFVLVQTSNPGSKDLQGLVSNGKTVSTHVAEWLSEKASKLSGDSMWSGLGAVVGATFPEDARALRKILPTNFFLIPGFGAQGGKASEAVAGFGLSKSGEKGGAVVNVSRGLLEGDCDSAESMVALIRRNSDVLNQQLIGALK